MTDYLVDSDTSESFVTWINQTFIPEDLKPELIKASILIVPTIGFRTEGQPTFPVSTENIFKYLKEHLPENIVVDICIADEDYHEIALHSDYKRLGNFLVKSVVLPVFIAVFSSYVYDTYVKHEENKPNLQIIIVDNSQTTNQITVNKPEEKKQGLKLPTHKAPTQTNVQFSVTVINSTDSSKISREFKFEGPAKEVKTVTDQIEKLYNSQSKENDTIRD